MWYTSRCSMRFFVEMMFPITFHVNVFSLPSPACVSSPFLFLPNYCYFWLAGIWTLFAKRDVWDSRWHDKYTSVGTVCPGSFLAFDAQLRCHVLHETFSNCPIRNFSQFSQHSQALFSLSFTLPGVTGHSHNPLLDCQFLGHGDHVLFIFRPPQATE